MSTFALFLLRAGFLVVLWLFVLATILVVRADLSPGRAAAAGLGRAPRPAKQPRQRRDRGGAGPRTLVVTQGPLAGTRVPLREDPITIGRAQDSTLVLSDEYVSSRHARLVPGGDGWQVEDLGSTNGTYLDRQRVTRQTPVPVGVPIRIGKTVLELRR